MLSNFKKLLLTILVSISFTIKPFSHFNLLVNKKTGKLVYLLGDVHMEDADYINERHMKEFQSKILENKDIKTQSKINCIVEIPKEIFEQLQEDKKIRADATLGKTFFLLSKFSKKENKFFNFIPYEPRMLDSDIALNLVDQIQFRFMKEEGFNINKFEITKDNSVQTPEFPISKYLDVITKMHIQLKKIASKYENHPIKKALDEKIKTFENAKDYIFKLFSTIDSKTFIMEAYLQLYKNNTTNFKEVVALEKKLNKAMLTDTNYLFADICFIEQILDEQEINSKTMLILGEDHIDKISNMLKEIGYESICQQNTWTTINEDVHYLHDQKGDFIENLITATQMFLIVPTKDSFIKNELKEEKK